MNRLLLPLLGVSLLSLASCSSAATKEGDANSTAAKNDVTGAAPTTTMPADGAKPENQPAATGTAQPTAGKGDPNGPTAPHADDKQFLVTAAHSDQNEIQQSKLALTKGVTGMAKEMANKMIADHAKSTADLKVIAAKKGVTLPLGMDDEHKAMVPAMSKLTGKAFEDKYMMQMAVDHQKTANTMVAHEQMTQDADVKGFIAKTLPVVESHLQMAQKSGTMKM